MPGNSALIRGLDVFDAIFAPDADEASYGKHRTISFCPDFSDRGIRSHILLAACSKNEFAREKDCRGNFTKVLLKLLQEVNPSYLTYDSLLYEMDEIDR